METSADEAGMSYPGLQRANQNTDHITGLLLIINNNQTNVVTLRSGWGGGLWWGRGTEQGMMGKMRLHRSRSREPVSQRCHSVVRHSLLVRQSERERHSQNTAK